jgi:subtilisin family serine protease
VQPDGALHLAETLPFGVERVSAYVPGGTGAYQSGFRGNGARIAVLDTGIDLDHPDLLASIDNDLGKNCVDGTLPPNDGYGHGTHTAGTAAAPLNGVGVVGVAPEARLVAVKMFTDGGASSEALALCALDHIIRLNQDTDPANDVDVANMSWGEQRAWGDCATDALHGAICRAHAAGIILVAGAGNSAVNAGSFVPAAYPEVLSISALADFDGVRGGLAGCGFVPELLWLECDDTFAFFSNYGASVDLIAPGVMVYSTWANGGWQTSSGTSMATPHVAGIAALMAAAAPGLTPDAARAALVSSGECPNGQPADADPAAGCTGQGAWQDDPDGTPEPLAHALRAVQAVAAAPPPEPDPEPPSAPSLSATAGDGSVSLTWTEPADDGGGPITAYEVYRGDAAGTATLLTTVPDGLEYLDASVNNGQTYWYQVAAVNSVGVGDRSGEVSATPQAAATAPSAPLDLAARSQRGVVNLIWAAPISDGGSALTGYRVYRGTSSGAWSFLEAVPAPQLSYADGSAEPRTHYFYVVRAMNATGEGPASNEVRVRSR